MNRRFIKYHPKSNTYVIEKRAYFDEDLVLAGNVIVGQEVSFWKDLKVKGKLDLGRGALVRGNVKADSALLCSGSRILGRLDVSSDLHLLDNAKVRAAYCKGDVLARPGCFMGFIKAEGTLEIIGKVNIRDVEPITKVIVRAEDMSLSVSEDTVNYTSEDMSQNIPENTPGIPENIPEN
ncbi:MAG: polymer-forming cytoskeletal protein, partial [Methanosarcinaceae archaeon]|nr:polymer-forming cytoskeletal protein [Methanosarcinaceae archaeon]